MAPGMPHHITQRGNRRMPTFFCEDDYFTYLTLLAEWCKRWHVKIWAWCLMPNHVHLVAVPETEEGLMHAIGETHRRYTRHVNFREGWRGHLWQGRFSSYVMDYQHTLAAVRYIELNPVRAGLVHSAGEYKWSSAQAHLNGRVDLLITNDPLHHEIEDWATFLATEDTPAIIDSMRLHERTGRPLGNKRFIDTLETQTGKSIHCRKPGPKKKTLGKQKSSGDMIT